MKSAEPILSLSTARLLGAVMASTAILGAAWWIGATALNRSSDEQRAGMVGIALVGVVAIVCTLLMSPSKPRKAGDWINVWLGGTVARLLLTPLAGFLLHSLVPMDARAFTLAIGTAYFTTVLAEAAVATQSLKSQAQPLPPL